MLWDWAVTAATDRQATMAATAMRAAANSVSLFDIVYLPSGSPDQTMWDLPLATISARKPVVLPLWARKPRIVYVVPGFRVSLPRP